MKHEKEYEFELYRLNIIDEDNTIFNFNKFPIRTDKEISSILDKVVSSTFDFEQVTQKSKYKWSMREYHPFYNENKIEYIQFIIARSLVEQVGENVTETGIDNGISEIDPPLATSILCFLYLPRHIVVVERNSSITSSKTWKKAFENISKRASHVLEFRSRMVLEPIIEKNELMSIFSSFSKLTRLAVKVRLPNPDLTRYTKNIYDSLTESGIRDYYQDMHNPNGLNREEGKLPHSSLSLAEAGYKDGNVTLVGIKDGKRVKEVCGQDAARGKLDILRDYIRGLRDNSKTKETKHILDKLTEEIEKIHPSEEM